MVKLWGQAVMSRYIFEAWLCSSEGNFERAQRATEQCGIGRVEGMIEKRSLRRDS